MSKHTALAAIAALTLMGWGTSAVGAATPAPDISQIAQRAGVPDPAVIAHRGASYYAPESTRAGP